MKFQVALLIVVSFSPSCYLTSEGDLLMNGLFFSLKGTIYCHNDSVCIEDIGPQPDDRTLLGATLVCYTANVNTKCCRRADNNDNGPVGNWFFPNNDPVMENRVAQNKSRNNLFVRIGYDRQVRMAKKGTAYSPVGRYTCQVPDEDGEMVCASINVLRCNQHATTTIASTLSPGNNTTCVYAMQTSLTTNTTMTKESISSEDSSTIFNVTNRVTAVQNNGGVTQRSGPVSPSGSIITPVIIAVIVIIIIIATIVAVVVLIILFRKRFFGRISSTKKTGAHQSPDVSEVYSLPDKSKKKNINLDDGTYDSSNISEMYAVVDKHAKQKGSMTYEATENPNISEMYAVVDKTAKKKANGSAEAPDSPNLQDMYAVVDKKAKKNRTLPERSSDQEISDMYSVVDRSAK